jgi:hypothetical protein
MTRGARLLLCALIALAAAAGSACVEGGIGMSPTSGGARWGGGSSGPDVFVGGGPVYR